jgi:hypothetical protein
MFERNKNTCGIYDSASQRAHHNIRGVSDKTRGRGAEPVIGRASRGPTLRLLARKYAVGHGENTE